MPKDSSILIIEDSPEDYEVCLNALTAEGNLANEIVWCQSGDDGLDYLRKEGKFSGDDHALPCLVLLDLNLPGLDGRDVLKELKSDPLTRRLPIIVMTTSRDPKDIDHCYEAGANSYIAKPVDLPGFLEAISRLRDYWFEVAVLPREVGN